MKPFLQIPEGAPFWKYNVKDEVVSAPVKAYNFSKNPENSHHLLVKMAEPKKCLHDFNCGRVKRRLEALKRKYEELHEHAQEDRFA